MKSITKITFLLAAFFVSLQIKAQTVVTADKIIEDIPSVPSVLAVPAEFNFPNGNFQLIQDQFLQNFSYYNNPEISKLENEVSLLGNVYTREKYGRKNYSADKYQNLADEEKKNLRNAINTRFYSYSIGFKDADLKNKTQDQRAEELFNKVVSQYLNSDGSVNKQKLADEIRRRLDQLFEMKEAEKQKEVTKLETQLKALQNTLSDRKKNKQQIIEQRMNDLVGLPNTLRW